MDSNLLVALVVVVIVLFAGVVLHRMDLIIKGLKKIQEPTLMAPIETGFDNQQETIKALVRLVGQAVEALKVSVPASMVDVKQVLTEADAVLDEITDDTPVGE